jgi:hypothetical protein
MSDKQTLQSQITQLKNVLASPKTDGTTKKILENGLKKAEAKLKELEEAEKMESSKKELTPKQEAKVEETKKESKSLADALKEKVKKAKQKIATTTPKATKKGGARSVAKAKELAKQRRSTQKKQSLKDSDIESDANRFAINKSKRKSKGGRANQYGTKAENKGGVYYEKRENRYDVQNKRYAKLEGGGMTYQDYNVTINYPSDNPKSGWASFDYVDIKVKATSMDSAKTKAMKEFKKLYPNKKGTIGNVNNMKPSDFDMIVNNKFADGGMMAGGKLKVNGEDFSFLLELSDKELSKKLDLVRNQKSINAKQYFSAREKGESTTKIEESGNNLDNQERAIIEARIRKNKMADGGTTDVGGTQFSTEDLSGMFAKGGITEHGLMIGDMIVGTSNDPYSIVVRNNGMESIVDLNEGTRMSNNQGTRFASRSMKDPMVVRTQFEEMDFEYGDGGYMASGGRITKGAKYMAKFNTSGGDSGYSIYKIVDTNYFSNKYGGSPHTIRYEVIESSHEKVGSFDESSRKDIQTQLKYGMWTKLDNYADGGTTDVGGTQFSTEDLSGMFMRGGMLNKKVNEKIKHYLDDSSASPMHQWEVKTILESALTDANFHKEAKMVDSVFPNARFTESVQFSKLQEDFLRDRLEDMGREIAKMSEYDGHEIINAIAFYVSMNMGRPLGQKVESLKNTMKKGGVTFKDKVSAISKKLKGKKVAPSVKKDYGKTYSKDEAIDSAKRIAGAMRKKEMSKKKS